jgi:hypothetical protein
MSQQSFTTSATVIKADNAIINRDDISLDAVTSSQDRDFLLLCRDSNIAEAVHALYYLPKNYKLMIMADLAHDSSPDTSWVTGMSFKDRIKFETPANENTETSKQKESPYSFADAIIADEANAQSLIPVNAPYVVVSSTAAAGLAANGANGFTVQSGNPEALASAILHIARKG